MRHAVFAAVLAFHPRVRGPAPALARRIGHIVLAYLDRRRIGIDGA